MARERTADQADKAMAHLAELADRRDEAGFASALQAMDWSSRPAGEVLRAVQLALMAGAFLGARRLSQDGADRYPAHAELQRYARVLAPPRVIARNLPPRPDLRANHDWMKREADAYRGQWIALRNGELLGTASSFDALADQFPDPRDILLTKIF
jgi:hypothetical protein